MLSSVKDAQKDWTDKRIAENKDFFRKKYNYDPSNLNFLQPPSPDGKYVCFGVIRISETNLLESSSSLRLMDLQTVKMRGESIHQ
ncbi:MAG: hypothetical protein IPO98_19520 [Saprospiraceae bacterium]|nr:hypothetical protein [Saprospiraceae bacterium]